MISNTLDFRPYREALARDGVVQVPDILQPQAAEALADCLAREVPWGLALRDFDAAHNLRADALAAMDAAEQRARLAAARARALAGGFAFAYDTYMLVRARLEGADPGLRVHVALDFFNSPEFLGFARWFAQDPAIDAVNAQATRYRPGQFLTLHDDRDEEEGRRIAYVLNLSPPGWLPAWGGLLRFPASDEAPERVLVPRWNSLSLFRVPRLHEVTEVQPAAAPRLAITGWWLARPPLPA